MSERNFKVEYFLSLEAALLVGRMIGWLLLIFLVARVDLLMVALAPLLILLALSSARLSRLASGNLAFRFRKNR